MYREKFRKSQRLRGLEGKDGLQLCNFNFRLDGVTFNVYRRMSLYWRSNWKKVGMSSNTVGIENESNGIISIAMFTNGLAIFERGKTRL